MVRRSIRSLTVVLSALLAGCGGSSTSPTATPPPPAAPTITAVRVSGLSAALKPGDTAQLAATATLSNGATEIVTAQASWRSDNTDIATVSAGGLVTAMRAGSTEVRATYQAVSGGMTVEIAAPPPPVAQRYALCGSVLETPGDLPIEGAYVEVRDRLNAGRNAQTNSAGRYCILNLMPDGFTAQAGKAGYDPQDKPFALAGDAILDFTLRKTAPPPPPPPPPPPVTPVITIGANGSVNPSLIIISVGQRVNFVNNHSVSHYMASDPHPFHGSCPEIDAVGLVQPGQTRATNVFTRTADCTYHDHNSLSPGLNGRIVVR